MLKLRHALFASICLLPLLGAEALAATAGVTAAVNQNAKSTPPGGGVRTVVLGANVVQDERIETDGAGLVQILLADGTTFTVGPNSSLVIDRFVYDPDANTAQVAASLGRGVFRFIGGRTSKTEGGVTLNTPVGTVGIRGGMADLNFTGQGGNTAQIDLLFGNEVTLNGPNGGDRLFQPGYSIIIGPNGQPSVIKTPPGSANFIQQALAGRPGSSGGNSQKPSDDDVEESGVADNNSGTTPPNPRDIPPPDLTAIDLATPKPTDIHQVAEEIGGGQQPSPGKRGFSAGVFYFDTTVDYVIGAPAHDLDGDTRVQFDASGNPIGGKMVVGLIGAEDVEGTVTDLKAIARVGDYPGAPSVSMSIGDLEVGTVTGGQTSIVSSTDLDPTDWPETELVECECVSWGTWQTSFGDDLGNDFSDAGLKGTWITGDIVTANQYDSFTTQDPHGKLYYSGMAAGYGQYTVGGVAGDLFAATGDIWVEWNLQTEVGTFELNDFGRGAGPDDHSFSASTGIARGTMEGGLFAGSDISTDGDSTKLLGASGAFINDGTNIGGGIMGSFSGIEVFTTGGEDAIFTGSGVYAGTATEDTLPPWTNND